MEKYKHTVHYYETDRMGFTHHSNYIRWMEEARIDFFDQLGWSYQKFEDEGVISPVTAIECKYKQTLPRLKAQAQLHHDKRSRHHCLRSFFGALFPQ